MDIGCGMGFFTLPIAEIVGKNGHVISVDTQFGMLEGLKMNGGDVRSPPCVTGEH